MAIPIAKNNSIIGLMEEVTAGTFLAPDGTGKYLRPLTSFEITAQREVLQREILTGSPGKINPIMGMQNPSLTIPVELRGSGTEGGATDFDALYKSAFGATRSIAGNNTTKSSGNTGSILQIEDADISEYTVNDIIVIKETGLHWPCVITAKDSSSGTANITISPVKPSGSWSNSVVISKSLMYYTAATGHPSLSVAAYLGNQVRHACAGLKVASMAIEGFEPGKLAAVNFGLQGMSVVQTDGVAPHTPAYDTMTPPVIVKACLYRAGVEVQVGSFNFNLQNNLAPVKSTCNENGKTGFYLASREVNGTFVPYMDDTAVTNYTSWAAGTEFSLFVYAFVPSATAGEMTFGSLVALYLPKCVTVDLGVGDDGGLLTQPVGFQACRGADGATEEAYLGMV